MSPMKHSNNRPFISDDRSAAERDARRRSSEQQIEYILGVREFTDSGVQFLVAPMEKFRELRDSGQWLIDVSYGRPITPDDLVGAYGCCDIGEAMLEATMRIGLGAPPTFIARRDGEYLVAPIADWPRYAEVDWVKLDEFAAR